jgi:hypothetical protein
MHHNVTSGRFHRPFRQMNGVPQFSIKATLSRVTVFPKSMAICGTDVRNSAVKFALAVVPAGPRHARGIIE